MKQQLLGKIAELGKELPLNTLDELIDQFGGPEEVSEVRVCMTLKNAFSEVCVNVCLNRSRVRR